MKRLSRIVLEQESHGRRIQWRASVQLDEQYVLVARQPGETPSDALDLLLAELVRDAVAELEKEW